MQRNASIIRHIIADKPTGHTKVSLNIKRILVLNAIFVVSFACSLAYFILPESYVAIDYRDVSTNLIGLDIKLGMFYFTFGASDGYIEYQQLYQPTTLSYYTYCRSAFFQTRQSNGDIIDRSFFCGNYWLMIVVLQSLAVCCGLFYFILLVKNIMVWRNQGFWFKPQDRPDDQVQFVRRLYKGLIMISVWHHWLFQTIVIAMVIYAKTNGLITRPSKLFFNTGFYITATTVGLDLLFLIIFYFVDRLLFFHMPE